MVGLPKDVEYSLAFQVLELSHAFVGSRYRLSTLSIGIVDLIALTYIGCSIRPPHCTLKPS